MPKTPPITSEDSELFRDAIGPVIVHRHTESRLSKARPKPRARMFERDELDALQQSQRVTAIDAALNSMPSELNIFLCKGKFFAACD